MKSQGSAGYSLPPQTSAPPAAHAATHAASGSDPVSLTKAQVGLGNVDNTSDANKPVSGPQADRFAQKANGLISSTVLASNGLYVHIGGEASFEAVPVVADVRVINLSGAAITLGTYGVAPDHLEIAAGYGADFDVTDTDGSGVFSSQSLFQFVPNGYQVDHASGTITAKPFTEHISVATHTYAHPAPTDGMVWKAFIRHGTATMPDASTYSTPGTLVVWARHSGAWAKYVYAPA